MLVPVNKHLYIKNYIYFDRCTINFFYIIKSKIKTKRIVKILKPCVFPRKFPNSPTHNRKHANCLKSRSLGPSTITPKSSRSARNAA